MQKVATTRAATKTKKKDPGHDSRMATDEPTCPFCGYESRKLGDTLRRAPGKPLRIVRCGSCKERYELEVSVTFFSDAPRAQQ